MELIQEACLLSLITSSVLGQNLSEIYTFDWNIIGSHRPEFKPEYNYSDARILLQLSMMVTNTNFIKADLEIPSWMQARHLEYTQCPFQLIPKYAPKYNYKANMGYVMYNAVANTIFVVFTGTSNECMSGMDVDYYQDELKTLHHHIPGIKGHRGIYAAYESIRTSVIESIDAFIAAAPSPPRIILTGHSLGGGISTLAAFDLAHYNIIHYSFASPQIFNPAGATRFDELVPRSYRIANTADLVTISPLSVMPNGDCFNHVGTAYQFQINLGKYHKNHSIAYMQEFDIPYKVVHLPV